MASRHVVGLALAVLLAETFNAASGINDLLLAGPERVAFGADFNVIARLAERGTGGESVAAGAVNLHFGVFGMAFGLHVRFLFYTDGECDRPIW